MLYRNKVLVYLVLSVTAVGGCAGPADAPPEPESSPPFVDDVFDTSVEEDHSETIETLTLAAGESKRFVIQTDVPIRIGFEADISREMLEKYALDEHAIRIEQVNDSNYLSSFAGASTIFTPVDDQIEIEVKNICEDPVPVRIFKEPKE